MMIAMLVVAVLILMTTFFLTFRETALPSPAWVGTCAVLLMFFAVSLLWPVVFENRVIPNLLPRVLASSCFSASAALFARLFVRERKKRRA